MSHIILNQKEIALLKSAIRKGDDNPEFQKFLVLLDHQLKEWSGEIYISENTIQLIQHYGGQGGKLSWRGILHSIFGRTMGDHFGAPNDSCTKLTETGRTSPVSSDRNGKHHRVV